VVTWAGDGGTFDIGLQALSGAAERNEDILYVCYDNEAYMNTGVQGSSATPFGAWTTTTPVGSPKRTRKKTSCRSWLRTGSPTPPRPRSPTPRTWSARCRRRQRSGDQVPPHLRHVPHRVKVPSEVSVRLARLAVQTRIFPLYEVEDGQRYTINLQPVGYLVDEYFKIQGRFAHLSRQDLDRIQGDVDRIGTGSRRWRGCNDASVSSRFALDHRGAQAATSLVGAASKPRHRAEPIIGFAESRVGTRSTGTIEPGSVFQDARHSGKSRRN